jgi:hypothetical protein
MSILEELREKFPEILEAWEVVNIYEFYIKDAGVVKVKVLRNQDGKYIGLTNLVVEGCADYHLYDSEEKALEMALNSFIIGYAEGKIRKSDNW